jgi:hypothetical protein
LNAELVRGNHDDKYIRYRKHCDLVEKSKKTKKKYKNPMKFDEEQTSIYNELSTEDLDWLSKSPSFIHIPKLNVLVVHAGVNPRWFPVGQKDKTYRHIRYIDNITKNMVKLNKDYSKPENSTFWAEFYTDHVTVIYGHNVMDLKDPRVDYNKIGGCIHC